MTKDEQQTEYCNLLRERLQSIAILAVQAQDVIGADKCGELLIDIEDDLNKAINLQDELIRLYSE